MIINTVEEVHVVQFATQALQEVPFKKYPVAHTVHPLEVHVVQLAEQAVHVAVVPDPEK